jgi:hypothetical protein
MKLERLITFLKNLNKIILKKEVKERVLIKILINKKGHELPNLTRIHAQARKSLGIPGF